MKKREENKLAAIIGEEKNLTRTTVFTESEPGEVIGF